MDKVLAPSLNEETNTKDEVLAHTETYPSNAVSPAEKRLLRKIDFHVLPILIMLVGLSSIDRINISAAKVAGMDKDLNLGGNRYNIVVLGKWLLFPFLFCSVCDIVSE